MIELKVIRGELEVRVDGKPEVLLAELTEAVTLVLDRIEELMHEQGYSAAARANLPNALWRAFGRSGAGRRARGRTDEDGLF